MRKIEFFSSVDGVADAFPIKPASEFTFKWVEATRRDYKEYVKKEVGRGVHVYRCPGIFDVMGTGYIVPLPWDIRIETNGDEENFKWEIPTADIVDLFKAEIVIGHSPKGSSKFMPVKPGSLETIIKINSPWHIIAPSDVKFLIIPIPYPDSYDFESVIGILDPSISSELNFQLRWNVLNGNYTIKAGTPMFQIIPLANERFDFDIRNMNDKDKKWLEKRRYFNNSTFLMNRPLIRKMYQKFFGV